MYEEYYVVCTIYISVSSDKQPSNTWKTAMILALGTTVFVELSQLIYWLREFQLFDLVHNIIGGVIGCALWHIKEALLYR